METRVANTFIKVAELGNITKAAEQLGYTQGAVTLQIKKLESELGVMLFDRVGRGVRLTEAGMRFREFAQRLVRASEDADAFAMDESDPSGELIIEANSSVSIGILPGLMHGFHDKYPHVDVKVRISEDNDILMEHLRQSRTDIAMMMGPRQSFPGCSLAGERVENFRFVAPPDDRLARMKDIPLEEVLDRTYVACFNAMDKNMDRYYVIESYLMQRGIDISAPIEFGAFASVINYLKKGGGHAYLPLYMIEGELERGELVILDTETPEVYEYTQMFYSSTRWLSPQMKAFITYAQEYLKQNE